MIDSMLRGVLQPTNGGFYAYLIPHDYIMLIGG